MSLLFDGNRVKFIKLTFLQNDAINRDNKVFSYPIGTDFTLYDFLYFSVSYLNIVTVTKNMYTLLPYTNKLVIDFSSVNGNSLIFTPGNTYTVLCNQSGCKGIDFIDRYNQTDDVFLYDDITISNTSNHTRLTNTYVISENLQLGFYTDYPLQQRNSSYTTGVLSPTLTVIHNQDMSNSKFHVFFNNIYVGTCSYDGNTYPLAYNTGYSGLVELIWQGILEFSLDKIIWLPILNIGIIPYNTSIQVYIRCNKHVTKLERIFNSIKVMTTEAV